MMQHYLLAISKYFIENENLETETGFVGGRMLENEQTQQLSLSATITRKGSRQRSRVNCTN